MVSDVVIAETLDQVRDGTEIRRRRRPALANLAAKRCLERPPLLPV
jgi:hypothetical protein